MIDLKSNFKKWLLSNGYKETTPSGKPSTIHNYINEIDKVCSEFHTDWQTLALNIYNALLYYRHSNTKETAKKKRTTALVKYNEYLLDRKIYNELSRTKSDPLIFKTEKNYTQDATFGLLSVIPATSSTPLQINSSDNQQSLTPTEVAYYLGITVKTLRMWRNKKENISFMKVGNSIRYPLSSVNEYLRSVFTPVNLIRK